MIPGIKLGNVMIDSKDDLALCSFYQQLLGWQRTELYGCPALISESGTIFLFMWETNYLPPVWPEEPGCQQKQMHFDFHVPDVRAAVEQAISLGARRAEAQFGSEDEAFVTMIDPAGHPFCLCASSNKG